MVINKILSYLLLILGITFYFFPYKSKTFYLLFFISFGLSILFKFIIKKMRLRDSEYLIVLIVIWLNALGELWFYINWVYYDKFLHFISSFFISMIYYSYLKIRKIKIDVFFLFTILGMLAFYEIVEWLIFIFFEFPMIGVYSLVNGSQNMMVMDFLTDTMIDLILGILGILTCIFFKKITNDDVVVDNKKPKHLNSLLVSYS